MSAALIARSFLPFAARFLAAWPHLRAGGILLSDDTDWNQAFPEFTALAQCPRIMFNFRVGAIRKPLVAAQAL